jgi:periplasmic protein TonB
MRLYTIFLSIAAHAAVLIVVVVVPLAAMDALPGIHVVTPFVRVTQADLPDVPPPPGSPPPSSSPTVNTTAAPLTAPQNINPELPPPGPVYDGPPGVPPGDPNGIVGLSATIPIPPPPPPVTKPVRPGGDIRTPTKTKHVPPIYPEIARTNRIQGVVMLEAVINEQGQVRDVRVVRSVPLLDNAAIDAVRQWQFTPTLLNGQPVPVLLTVTLSFVLN